VPTETFTISEDARYSLVFRESANCMFHLHDDKLHYTYKGCEKTFDKPTVLTDETATPRQSYYAHPHCMPKLDIVTEGLKIVEIKPTEYPTVFESPAKCAHFSGLMSNLPENAAISDDCLICPKDMQCNLRQR
jgi:hypothetical protein